MARPVTLAALQWADLPFEEVAEKAIKWGFDGIEVPCWGGHFDVQAALYDDGYVEKKREILKRNGLGCWALSAHLVGQAVCDYPIDERHQALLPERVWGDGEPEGVRRRASEEMKDTARAAAKFGVDTVSGFTGSSIWHLSYGFPFTLPGMVERGYEDFAERWTPIIDIFEEEGVRFALEVHPSEIAYDFYTTEKTLEAIGDREGFGITLDPSHFNWQFVDTVTFIHEFGDKIYHVHCKEAEVNLDGRSSILGSHLPWGHPQRGWNFVIPGRRTIEPFEKVVNALNAVGYEGSLSVEWDDLAIDREWGIQEALRHVRSLNYEPSKQMPGSAFFET